MSTSKGFHPGGLAHGLAAGTRDMVERLGRSDPVVSVDEQGWLVSGVDISTADHGRGVRVMVADRHIGLFGVVPWDEALDASDDDGGSVW